MSMLASSPIFGLFGSVVSFLLLLLLGGGMLGNPVLNVCLLIIVKTIINVKVPNGISLII